MPNEGDRSSEEVMGFSRCIEPHPKQTECPFASLSMAIGCHSRDWAAHRRDAWIWGIVCGWDDESLAELQERFQWEDGEVDRLKRLRVAFVEAHDLLHPEDGQ